ncbi:MFS transporter [Paenibacillus sp. N1-5-1-14]|uniref:MFS transporter n=1 Tax=Paenibacillus radicibacter TaxID=2972488 RepID=UPI00215904A2|nr:MFS transporter [Paenibacillus radicibacter]MCR8642468.1 MFS transporter [Paenibacillus radicibacter]
MESTEKVQRGLWHNKSYRYLISSQLVSNLGDWLDLLALFALLSLKWQVTSMEMAYVMICFGLPMVLFGPISGVLADRFERRTLMIISDVLRIPLVLAFIFATNIWQIYIILLLKGSLAALFNPAKNGKLKEIVAPEHMDKAVAYSTMIEQVSKIAGPIVSGVLLSSVGIAAAFYIDAASFLVSALLLIGIPVRKHFDATASADQEHKSILQDLKLGFTFMSKVPFILFGTGLFCMTFLVLQIADTQVMILLREIPGMSAEFIGIALASSGIGLLGVAALLNRKPVQSIVLAMCIGIIGLGIVFVLAAWFASLQGGFEWLIPVSFMFGGASAGLVIIPFNVTVQKRTPVEYSGRVFGTIGSLSTLMSIIGPMIGGIIATVYGVMAAFVWSGSLLAILGIIALLLGKSFDRRSTHVTESA